MTVIKVNGAMLNFVWTNSVHVHLIVTCYFHCMFEFINWRKSIHSVNLSIILRVVKFYAS